MNRLAKVFPWFLKEKGSAAITSDNGKNLPPLNQTIYTEGHCLILLDGLDEIVSADDRRAVVRRIEDFVRRYDNAPNGFVVTSRVAGYRALLL